MGERLKTYLNGCDLPGGAVRDVTELSDGESHNHLNYKITTERETYVARMVKKGDAVNHANLSDEYLILTLVEKYRIAPKPICIDLEHFEAPILLEEYIDGTLFANMKSASEASFNALIELIFQTSELPISHAEFPFKFEYSTYEANFSTWRERIKEIADVLGKDHEIVKEFKRVTQSAEKLLNKKEELLKEVRSEFIYNDIHPGNVFFLTEENRALFIDWQKVSWGDPSFMIALLITRFAKLFEMEREKFLQKVIAAYEKKKQIPHLEELVRARILERTVSDMIWVVWQKVKNGAVGEIKTLAENKYYQEAKKLLTQSLP